MCDPRDELYGDPCEACGYREHNIPSSSDSAHDELCCGRTVCPRTEMCVTHEWYPVEEIADYELKPIAI